jgi:glyoxalase/bleomycin resistance protein/dioxygenase superfamily protein
MDAKVFRIIVEVGGADAALDFYSKLLDAKGRRVGGGRVYFECGSTILALLEKRRPSPLPEHIYFAVATLDEVHARATELRCLSTDEVHGESAAKIAMRPWGERSFYVEDPWSNKMCFVDENTLFTGEETR